MTKYGRDLRFGYCLRPNATDPTRPLALAALAETLGLDYIGLQDQPDDHSRHDAWTLLTAIGAATTRISLIARGDDLPLRPPALVAKAAASLDLLTNGRVELDLGATAFCETAINGTGLGDEATLAALEEIIELMRLVWRGDKTATFNGKFFRLDDVTLGPQPAHPIGIWLDMSEQYATSLIGQFADGWIPEYDARTLPEDLAHLNQQIDEAAEMAGRATKDIQRVYKIVGTIRDEENNVPFGGSAKQWAERIGHFATQVGMDTFLLCEHDDAMVDVEEQLQRFAQEVMPLARELAILAPGIVIDSGLARAFQGAAASGATVSEEETDDVDWVDETSMESFPASDPPASSSFT